MAKAKKATQLNIQAANRVGLLTDIAGLLARSKVNIHCLCAYAMGDQATLMMIVDRHATAKKALTGAGYTVNEDAAIQLDLANKPGEMAKAAAKVSSVGIDIEYIYATAAGKTSTIVIKSRDNDGALKALRK